VVEKHDYELAPEKVNNFSLGLAVWTVVAPHEVYEEETCFRGRVLAVNLDFLRVDAQHPLLVPQHVYFVAFAYFKELGV